MLQGTTLMAEKMFEALVCALMDIAKDARSMALMAPQHTTMLSESAGSAYNIYSCLENTAVRPLYMPYRRHSRISESYNCI